MTTPTTVLLPHGVAGQVAPGWEPVATAFAANFEAGLETGAALAVHHGGRPVVDLWGGVADSESGRPWQRDTVACVFSSTKGLAAICAHMLIERGLLELDTPVATYWPEFAAAGKEDLTVRWVLTHQAGLLALDQDLTFEDAEAVTPVLRAIEAQRPLWEPGTAFGYHSITFGYLVGELVRRVTGRTLGSFIHDEIVTPLGLSAVLGLDPAAEIDLARIEAPAPKPDFVAQHGEWVAELVRIAERGSRLSGAFSGQLNTGTGGDLNDRRTLALELGGASMVSDARSLAKAYAATVTEVDGVRLISDATAAACAPSQTAESPPFGVPPELVQHPPTSGFGLGYMHVPMLGPSSFGHPGAMGSVAFADLDARLSLGYVPNQQGPEGSDRVGPMLAAVRDCLDSNRIAS